MKVIWKFPINGMHSQFVRMSKGAKILSVQFQVATKRTCLWAVCDDLWQEQEDVEIAVCGTGTAIPTVDTEYIGTVQDINYEVWHIFRINKHEGY
jgi:hypothetical protein